MYENSTRIFPLSLITLEQVHLILVQDHQKSETKQAYKTVLLNTNERDDFFSLSYQPLHCQENNTHN